MTGGLLCAALTRSPGSSASFRGGLVVYATDLKAALAGVSQPLLDAQGPVSAEVAQALACGVRERLKSDLGLGITGVAGPDPVDGRPVGTVFVAVAGPDFSEVSQSHLVGSRTQIRAASVEAALDMLMAVLTAVGGPGMRIPTPGVTP